MLRLLTRARATLSAKYGVTLTQPTLIEIFAAQKDFAIRTFGLPGGGDFLGVCFGAVVTINSPANRGENPSNWEATLWHEFCHTVTLTKTKNKMPRWLSEGISVYEESQENPTWGQHMSPTYRQMILAGGTTPVSKLSSAFMTPKTPVDLMFAYYESSMVVDYINEKYGAQAVRFILGDLAVDIPINEALERHTEPIARLDAHFEEWFKTQADQLAPRVDWTKPKVAPGADLNAAMAKWLDHRSSQQLWGAFGTGRDAHERSQVARGDCEAGEGARFVSEL